MDIDLSALPDDVQTLQRMVRTLVADRTALSEAQAEIERLRLIVQRLQRSQFGQRAERLDDHQLLFGFEDLETDIARAEAKLPPDFQSVVDLQLTINRFVADTNADPKPFVWTADPKRVLAAIKRGKQTLESIH
jgi:hypothetical protein